MSLEKTCGNCASYSPLYVRRIDGFHKVEAGVCHCNFKKPSKCSYKVSTFLCKFWQEILADDIEEKKGTIEVLKDISKRLRRIIELIEYEK